MLFFAYVFITSLFATLLTGHEIQFKVSSVDEKTLQMKVIFNLEAQEFLYKDSLDFSVDCPDLTLSDWHSSIEAFNRYDEVTKDTKAVFQGPVSFILYANKQQKQCENPVFLYVTYQLNTQPYPAQKIHQLIAPKIIPAKQPVTHQESQPSSTEKNKVHETNESPSNTTSITWSHWISDIIHQTPSLPLRLLAVFLLGILMSLTPCIYPMIPITVGILHAQKGTSFFYNLLLSSAYAIGLSTTFACFGLIAGYTGPIYGKLLSHPLFIILLITFLLYLAFSMFGFYEIYIPRFLQNKTTTTSSGSLMTAFLFGVASGTISSPCVSPGLILLLSIVATIGSVAIGFLLLFFFGLGLSTPLFIVGTFSGALASFPRAGIWMIEVKKFFGIMLIGASLYYLQPLISIALIMIMLASCFALFGCYYIYKAPSIHSIGLRMLYHIIGFIFLMGVVISLTFAYQEQFYEEMQHAGIHWHYNYHRACKQAIKEKKLLFIDCWAEFCSICKTINTTLLQNTNVIKVLDATTININANGTSEDQEPFLSIKKLFNIMGFPTFLLVDPTTQKIVKRWHSELYQTTPTDFVTMINEYNQSHQQSIIKFAAY